MIFMIFFLEKRAAETKQFRSVPHSLFVSAASRDAKKQKWKHFVLSNKNDVILSKEQESKNKMRRKLLLMRLNWTGVTPTAATVARRPFLHIIFAYL